jgi:carbon storage regulator CsrA
VALENLRKGGSNRVVLRRQAGERIRIGEDIFVEVRRVEGNRVTVAIDAPRHVRILRGELEPFADEFADAVPAEAPAEPYRAEYFQIPRPQRSKRRSFQSAIA